MMSFFSHTLKYFQTTPGWVGLSVATTPTTFPPQTKFVVISYSEFTDEFTILTMTSTEESSPLKDSAIPTQSGKYRLPPATLDLSLYIYAYLPPTTQEKDA